MGRRCFAEDISEVARADSTRKLYRICATPRHRHYKFRLRLTLILLQNIDTKKPASQDREAGVQLHQRGFPAFGDFILPNAFSIASRFPKILLHVPPLFDQEPKNAPTEPSSIRFGR